MEAVIDSTVAEPESPQTTEADLYRQAIADIGVQLHQLDAAFTELDNLHSEEKELQESFDQAVTEEKTLLADPSGSEKAVVDKLVRIRATRDIRNAKLDAMRKRIGSLVDVICFDIGSPLRKSASNLAHALLVARRARFLRLFNELIPTPFDHGVPFLDNELLVRICYPVANLQNFVNTVHRESRPSTEEELTELRSEVPKRWLAELRAVLQQEAEASQ